MTEDELKALPPDGVDPAVPAEDAADPAETKSAADETAERFAAQRKALEETAAAERQARLAAEQRAHEREQEVTRYRGETQSAQMQVVTNAIAAAQSEIDAAKRDYRAAMDAGEFDKAADAQERISLSAADKRASEWQKQTMEQHLPGPSEGRVDRPQQQQQQFADPIEAFIASLSPSSQTWLRQHRDVVVRLPNGRAKLDDKVMAAHHLAVLDGKVPDSAEYFAAIEARLNPRAAVQDDNDDDNNEPSPVAAARRAAPVAAPVTRDPPSASGRQPTQRMRLSADQVDAAHRFGDPRKSEREREIDYWNNLKALEAEGKVGDTRH